MEQFTVKPIGKVRSVENGVRIELQKEFIPLLQNFKDLVILTSFGGLVNATIHIPVSKLVEKSFIKILQTLARLQHALRNAQTQLR